MPLYEYECDTNGHRFEVIQKFSDPPIESCPTCGSTVHKLVAAPAFHLKGSGWYITDYAKKDSGGGKAESAKSEKSEKSDSAAQSGKTEKTESSTTKESTTSGSAPATKSES